MATTEIEKLERRYAENPQGLTFAPLAEVHRKNGEVARALELLKAGLELHPNYIPASIVLGRCHWDLGDLPAAEAAFSHVLRLDDENVIALKSLADIYERLERFSEAQRWLNRLISVDRSNEEARQQLARLESAKQSGPASGSAKAQPGPAEAELPADSNMEPVPPPNPAAVAADANGKPDAVVRAGLASEPADEPSPPLSTESQPEAQAVESQPEPQAEAPAPVAESAPAKDFPPAQEPAGLDLTAVIADPKSDLEFLDVSAPAAPPEPVVSEEPPAEEPHPSPEEPSPLPGLVSQEFVPPQQGAYRAHPELTQDFGLLEPSKAEDLQVETASEVDLQSSGGSEFRVPNAAEEFMDAASEAAPASPPKTEARVPPAESAPVKSLETAPLPESNRPYSVRETKGRSVAVFFEALLSARPAGHSAAHSTEPTMPEPMRSSTPAGSQSSTDASVSFDDFFGSAAAGSNPSAKKDTEGKDDLDQFQSWLQNLKR
jgi:tetratricopeptide repeat protein